MTVDDLPLSQILSPLPRKRPVDAAKVLDLAKSLEQQGLYQAIGVLPQADGTYLLVFGAHRLEAARQLGWETIAASLLPPDLADEEYQLIELQENSARHDLTGAQRKAYTAEIGRLLSQMAKKSHSPNGTDLWLIEMGQRSGIPRTTLYNWWSMFCEALGLAMTPKQALEMHKQQFYDWLEDQQRQATAAKTAREVADREARRQQACIDALQFLEELVSDYGLATVLEDIVAVFLTRHPAEGGPDAPDRP